MSIIRHAPDPLLARDTLCGDRVVSVGDPRHVVASVGNGITCSRCRVVIKMAQKCIAPHNFVLARVP